MIDILFFIESLSGGGAEKVLRNLVNAMDQTRFSITVQTLYPEDVAAQLAPGIHYKFCYASNSAVNRTRMRLEAALGLTYRLHIRDKYDIEVAYLECGSTKIMAGSTNKRALKLAWVHCDLAKKADDPAAFARETAKYYRRFDRVVCVSDTARQSFETLFPGSTSAITLYNTVNDADVRKKANAYEPPYQKNTRNLVCVGRLSPEKGVDRLLRLHTQMLAAGIHQHLWLIGDGPDRESLERYAQTHALSETVHFEGFRDNPYPYIARADLLVCPSYYEGFSTFVTEGLILGKPIVTTACSGMHELLGNSEYGLITDNNDDALYLGLKRMLTEPGLLAHYTQRAAVRRWDFRQEALVRETEEFFLREYAVKTEKVHGR